MRITGITGTLHTSRGDVEMGEPTDVSFVGSRVSFRFQRYAIREMYGWLEAFTLRLGDQVVRKPIGRREEAYPGGDCIVYQDLEIELLP
jgi:hypothetical protein